MVRGSREAAIHFLFSTLLLLLLAGLHTEEPLPKYFSGLHTEVFWEECSFKSIFTHTATCAPHPLKKHVITSHLQVGLLEQAVEYSSPRLGLPFTKEGGVTRWGPGY